MKITDKERKWLGQIYTPNNVATYMINELLTYDIETILEPCFGEGAFLKRLQEEVLDKIIYGVEIDQDSFRRFNNDSALHLYNMNFFDFSTEVDSIIMNPPYLRQKELSNSEVPSFTSKDYIRKQTEANKYNISNMSNLYIYFFLKSYQLLKENGVIVSIVPNVWMDTAYGISFKEFIKTYFSINKIIEFEKDVFPNATVESCILILQRRKKLDHKVLFQTINSSFEILEENEISQVLLNSEDKWHSLLKSKKEDNIVSLSEIANIKRGLSTNFDPFYIKQTSQFKNIYPEYFQEIVCSPKEVLDYETRSINKIQSIFLTKDNKSLLPKDLFDFINSIEKDVLVNEGYKIIKDKIKKKPEEWYSLNEPQVAPLLFSYIIRKNKKFIYNSRGTIARSNFYEIHIEKELNALLLFSLLNSSYVKYQLELNGRFYGNGMLKIQKYELDNIKIVNPSHLTEEECNLLIYYGNNMLSEKNSDNQWIKEIDNVLSDYLKEDYYFLEKELSEKRNKKKG